MKTTRRWRRSGAFLAVWFLASSAHGAHPLNTEDTGVQGKGRWQLEVNGERNEDKVDGEKVRGAQAAVVLSYGVAETVDLQVGLPWLDTGTEKGIGDAIAAVKWRFWEKDELSFGVRAGASFPTGDDERGLGNGRATGAALLVGQYEGKSWIFLAHAGYRYNNNRLGDRKELFEVSGAVLYKATEKLKLLADAVRGNNPDASSDTALRQVVIGAIYSPTENVDFDAGVRRGNEPAIDRAFMLGVTLRW